MLAAATELRRSHVGVVTSGAALAAAAVYTATHDPAAKGSLFPGCLFHATTGWWCPGCGLTRGVHSLLTLHPIEALGHNVFTPLAVIAIAGAWLAWALRTWMPHRTFRSVSAHTRSRIVATTATALVVYGVLRNLPVAPFRSLAP